MSHAILVICEAPDDFELGSRLIDRTIEESEHDWIRDCGLDAAREYFGIHTEFADAPEPFVRWQYLNKIAIYFSKDHPQRRQLFDTRKFGSNLPDHPDAFEFIRFLRVLQTDDRIRQPDAIVLLRDADTDSERRDALLHLNVAFRNEHSPVLVGVPNPEQECWRLAGFEHEMTPDERAAIDALHRRIDVHPIRESHRLRASNRGDDRNPKRVLELLTNRDTARSTKCLEAPFQLLRRYGDENGLAAFLNLLQTRLLSGLFGGSPPAGASC